MYTVAFSYVVFTRWGAIFLISPNQDCVLLLASELLASITKHDQHDNILIRRGSDTHAEWHPFIASDGAVASLTFACSTSRGNFKAEVYKLGGPSQDSTSSFSTFFTVPWVMDLCTRSIQVPETFKNFESMVRQFGTHRF